MMRAGFVCVAVLAAGAMVGAQSQSGGSRAGAQTTSAARSQRPTAYDPAKSQVVEGCLKPTRTAGLYEVDNAMIVNGGTVGTSGSSAKSYTIVGVIPPSVRLKDHVGHKVQLNGSVIDGGKFDMSDFKMISKTCS